MSQERATTAAYGYGSPHFYDLTGDWLGPDQPEVRFYLEYARNADRAVEIGAGTGRIAVELAARGVHVYCVEPDDAMRSALLTKVAQRREVQPHVTVVRAGGSDFELGRTTPLAYAANVLQHLLTDEEVLATLRNVRRHLEPGGLFLFDALGAREPKDVPATVFGERRVGEVLYRTTYETRRLSPDHYKLDVLHEALDGDRPVERARVFSINRYVRREAMRGLLERAGFEVAGEVVAYGGGPSTGREDRVVIEARRP